MEGADIRKLMTAISALGLMMVFLVISAIGLILMVQYQPEILAGWFANSKEEVVAQEDVPVDVEWTSEKLEEVGLVEGEGLQLVLANCTNCHSAKLVTQNRFTREGWIQVIRWMQETQGFWDLGPNEDPIVDYLSTHFAPEAKGRRKPLEVEWYSLE
ncbi:MAG: cytochrome C [Mongoliibacter sp.]|uniref:cytochrome C n=1 Tax=Mongoliibacter sp. TaxID=2022438 RepID=UPI0012F2C993|nr:cytochrome C [Mongoliibacter sp.]TVP53121.1 MAG: cytochrome C [Mongoliibacter sp.]